MGEISSPISPQAIWKKKKMKPDSILFDHQFLAKHRIVKVQNFPYSNVIDDCGERNHACSGSKRAQLCLACRIRSEASGEIELTSSWSWGVTHANECRTRCTDKFWVRSPDVVWLRHYLITWPPRRKWTTAEAFCCRYERDRRIRLSWTRDQWEFASD